MKRDYAEWISDDARNDALQQRDNATLSWCDAKILQGRARPEHMSSITWSVGAGNAGVPGRMR